MLQLFEDFLEQLGERHRDIEKAITGLSVEALDWVPGPDMNSLCVIIVHLTGAERYWIGEMVGEIPANRDRPSEFAARGLDEAELKRRLTDSMSFARTVLENLTIEEMNVQRSSPFQNRAFTKGLALLHALEHTALHTGHAEITRQLWDQRSQ